ncbi:S24 family peptidase [Roseomonas sp. HF4]|uniref:LexA family transcriptional regulator n=1 Tax=Roseomonas sp. HF4 TaxID=2562313 RepID=UPI001980267D|nr:S24 family peptidase [Roseomonas sp. HF4]
MGRMRPAPAPEAPYSALVTVEQIKEGLARPGKSQKGLAAVLGVDNSTVSRLLTGKRPLRVHEVPQILAYLESGGGSAAGRSRAAMPDIVQIGGDRYAMIPVYDAASPVAGDDELPEAPLYRTAFRVDWLRQVSQGEIGDLIVVVIDGDAMEPTLRHGDRVLVDMGSRRPQQKDGIYLLRTAGGLQAKRVAANPLTGLVTVISDNREHYPCFSDLQPDDITVVGRVTWLGRQVGA